MRAEDETQDANPAATMNRFAELLIVGVLSFGLALWWVWPMPTHMAGAIAYPLREMPGVTADLYLVLWSLAWDVHILLWRPWQLFHGNMLHPSPYSLAYSEHFLGALPFFAPAYLATGDPIASLNTLILAAYTTCAVAMYAFLREWANPPSAILGAIAFSFTAYRYSIAPYVYLLCTCYLPLSALMLRRWTLHRGAVNLAMFSVFVLLQCWTSYYLAYLAVIALSGMVLATIASTSRPIAPLTDWAKLASAMGGVAILLVLSSMPYLKLRAQGIIPTFDETNVGDQLTTLGLVPYFGALRVKRYWLETGSPMVFVAMAGTALLVRREWRWPLVLGCYCIVMGAVLSFGRAIYFADREWWSPYRLFSATIPGFSAIRQPIRFIALFEFGLAILVGLGAERVFGGSRKAWVAGGLALSLWFVSASKIVANPLDFLRPAEVEAMPYEWLAKNGDGKPVLEIPKTADFTAAARRMYMSTIHWLPIVDGYSGYRARSDLFLHGIASRLPDHEALQELVDYGGFHWVLVHLEELSADARSIWLGGQLPGLTLVEQWEDHALLRIDLSVRENREARLFSETLSLGGAPLVPLAGNCTGWLELDGEVPARQPASSRIELRLKVTNGSTQIWPAQGLLPRHLVRARYAMLRVDGKRLSGGYGWLPTDVSAGSTVGMALEVDTPKWPGDYFLRIELEQVKDKSLSGCGVVPLEIGLHVFEGREIS